jgi:hypothetical protein
LAHTRTTNHHTPAEQQQHNTESVGSRTEFLPQKVDVNVNFIRKLVVTMEQEDHEVDATVFFKREATALTEVRDLAELLEKYGYSKVC